MRSKTTARDRLLGEDMYCMRDYPAIRARLLNMLQASRKRHASRFQGQTSIKRQAFIPESDQQKEACF